jgi:hypothetical protein
MSVDLSTEILSAHADQLNKGKPVDPDAFLAAFPGQQDELVPLLSVAARVKHTLTPVTPDPAFRKRLHNGLLMAAHHQAARKILIEKRGEPQWGWLLGAAAIGSAAGILAMVWRSRSQDHKGMATVTQPGVPGGAN